MTNKSKFYCDNCQEIYCFEHDCPAESLTEKEPECGFTEDYGCNEEIIICEKCGTAIE